MLKTIAKKRGIKLGWIAEQVGIEATKFSRIANGTQLPNIDEGLKIAELLKVDARDLWPIEDDEEHP